MKRWYGPNVECPDCGESVQPEFYTGFWRFPEHVTPEDHWPCGTYGEKVVAT